MNLYQKRYEVRFAKNDLEIIESQRLRYRVFIKELGGMYKKDHDNYKREVDKFDKFYRHLIIIDHDNSKKNSDGKIIGVTRLMLSDDCKKGIGFYSSQEFNLKPIEATKKKCLEIGRTCIDYEYRNSLILHYLWMEIGSFCTKNKVDLLFGVASFSGIKFEKIAMALSYIHDQFLAPSNIRPIALEQGYINMDIIPKEKIDKLVALNQIPSLLKSYLRLGAKVGEGAFLDIELNTIDILIIIEVTNMTKKYKAYYEKL